MVISNSDQQVLILSVSEVLPVRSVELCVHSLRLDEDEATLIAIAQVASSLEDKLPPLGSSRHARCSTRCRAGTGLPSSRLVTKLRVLLG